MAKYHGTYKCGHEGVINVTGRMEQREYIILRKFSGLCEECFENQKQKKIEEENALTEIRMRDMDLISLQGSEKQVIWANALRLKLLDKIDYYISSIQGIKMNELIDIASSFKINLEEIEKTKESLINEVKKKIIEFEDFILSIDKASFFINHRHLINNLDTSIRRIITSYMKGLIKV